MCGIAGIYNLKQKPDNIDQAEIIRRMTDRIKHRGPDGEGFFIEDQIALGHRRLAILDLSPSGAQPMFNEDKNFVLVFNGEIYNYLEIARELKELGHQFNSQTDTEVILHAYEEWQEKCLDHFSGMWAFALWDRKKKELFCALDRWGVKPFYYHLDQDKFIFASEIKAILENDSVKPAPNYNAIFDFLVFNRTDHNEGTCFEGIKRLMPGQWLKIKANGRSEKKTWYKVSFKDVKKENMAESQQKLRLLLERSIELRLRSDVPVGSCLSGGLDSSTIVGIIKKKNPKANLKTFSAVFPHSWADESKYINSIKRKYQLENYQTNPTSAELLKDLRKLIYHQEEPFGSSSIFASWSVMKLVHKHRIKVLLDGQGGDEILAGYPYMAGFYFYEILRTGHIFCTIREIYHFWRKQKNNFLSAMQVLIFKLCPKFLQQIVLRFSNPYLSKEFFNRYRKESKFAEDFFGANSLNESLAIHLRHKISHLLRYEDKNAMAFSIENREIYLDHQLVEFSLNSSSSLKINKGMTKAILREAVKDVLPKQILNRSDKIGFDTPEELWFKDKSLLALLEKIIYSDEFMKRKIFNANKIQRLFEMFKIGKIEFNPIFWKVICLELWFLIFMNIN